MSAAPARRRPLARAFALAAVLLAPAARADDAAVADTLWRAGRELFAKNDFAAACPKFDASLKLDRQLGTLLNLAECNGKLGKLAAALGEWREGIEWAKKNLAIDPLDPLSTQRLEYATRELAALEPRVPKLRIDVRGDAPSLRVTRNGETVDPALYGLEQPLDPGTYRIAVRRGEQQLEERTLTLDEGKTERIALDLAVLAAKTPPPPPDSWPTPQVYVPPPKTDPAQRIAGIAVTAAGGAAVLIAGGLELGALVKKGQADRDDNCVNKFCAPQGLDAATAARRFAEAGQWLGIGGLVGTAVGLTVLFTAPAAPETAPAPADGGPKGPAPGVPAALAPWVGPDGAGLTVWGAM